MKKLILNDKGEFEVTLTFHDLELLKEKSYKQGWYDSKETHEKKKEE